MPSSDREGNDRSHTRGHRQGDDREREWLYLGRIFLRGSYVRERDSGAITGA